MMCIEKRRMATETEPREADNPPEARPSDRTEAKPNVRRTNRRTTRKTADTEKSDASSDAKGKAPEAEAVKPGGSEVADPTPVSEGGKGIPRRSSDGADRDDRDRASAARERGDAGDERSSHRGSDRRGRRGDSQGGFRKKGKKGPKKGRGRARSETPGWIQPLPPGEIIQIFGDMPDLSLYTDLEVLASKAADHLSLTGATLNGNAAFLFNFIREKNIPVI
ncbi:MAG: hypothetical protein DRP71_03110, partial [Verrucomicrobia bacterium]